MRTLHVISHTHWDREWHQPFQIFRIWLAATINKTLDILASDPDYKFFMLDGQTVVLEDYIELQPEREQELKKHVQSGRVLVGPWYVLPDMFLVSGESLIRNLQRGISIANQWGKSMRVGYIPDPFGHVSQTPQILKGFGIDVAMFRRGLADEQTELWWEGADGTRVLTTYLRDGYDNAAWLPRDPQGFVHTLGGLVQQLEPYAASEHMLMMHGTDHMMPWEGLPERMRLAERELPDTRVIHSTLPLYAEAVEQALTAEQKAQLGVVRGELRNPKRHHLLPGVVSTRMWIKQRNMRGEVLLEHWAEPLAAVAMSLHPSGGEQLPSEGLQLDVRPELDLAWRYLLLNHPHDSICGCSIDQVHEEMKPRFDWVEQVGGDIVERALAEIQPEIDTRRDGIEKGVAIVVFNPGPGPLGEGVTLTVDFPRGLERYRLVDGVGNEVPSFSEGLRIENYSRVTARIEDIRWTIGAAQSGSVEGHKLVDFEYEVKGDHADVDLTLSDQGQQDMAVIQRALQEFAVAAANPELKLVNLTMHSLPRAELSFFAGDLPAYGYRTFWLVPSGKEAESPKAENGADSMIENEYLRVSVSPNDGTVTLTDKASGAVFDGGNRFVDGGDRGDLYNFTPPEQDEIVAAPVAPPAITRLVQGGASQQLRIDSILRVPASLGPDRSGRSSEMADLAITTLVTLYAGARRVDFLTRVENTARDHRLRVLFGTPIQTDESHADQAFDIVTRPIRPRSGEESWVEQPVATFPMQKFVDLSDAHAGLVLATRGLMEYEVDPGRQDSGVTIALTLLRSVGWLSRPDLHNRRGDAGPEKQTPGAQELGVHEFEYSVIPYTAQNQPASGAGLLTRVEAHAQALGFAEGTRAVATDLHNGVLASSGSWVSVAPSDFQVTAIKPPAAGDGIVVRGFNSGDATIRVRLKPFRSFGRVDRVNLNEERLSAMNPDKDGAVEFEAKPREILTVRFS